MLIAHTIEVLPIDVTGDKPPISKLTIRSDNGRSFIQIKLVSPDGQMIFSGEFQESELIKIALLLKAQRENG